MKMKILKARLTNWDYFIIQGLFVNDRTEIIEKWFFISKNLNEFKLELDFMGLP